MKVEEQYMDVLQNIEAAIVAVFGKNPQLTDYNVLCALQAAVDCYKAEQRQQMPKPAALNEQDRLFYEPIRQACEWRLGRSPLDAPKPDPKEDRKPLSLDEMLLCLKRLHKSAEFWNREAGRQGYLTYIKQYIK